MKRHTEGGLRMLGVGAAACVACCAGPILAFLGGLGLAGLASVLVIGTSGLLIAAVASVVLLFVRRHRSACPTPGSSPVPVASPSKR